MSCVTHVNLPICSAVKAPTPPCVGPPDRVICVGWERLPALA
jgi:hypothetical protein